MFRLFLLAVMVSFAIPILAQEPIDKHDRYSPTPEQIETSKRMGEILRKATFIRLRLVFSNPNTGETSDLAPAYKSGDRIAIRVILNHSYNGPISCEESRNQYKDLQLELLRDGDVVPYNKEAQLRVEKTSTEPPNDSSMFRQLPPEKDHILRTINLLDWYETLLPGHYQLTAKRRFVWGGEWVQSESLTFDVGPPGPMRDKVVLPANIN